MDPYRNACIKCAGLAWLSRLDGHVCAVPAVAYNTKGLSDRIVVHAQVDTAKLARENARIAAADPERHVRPPTV